MFSFNNPFGACKTCGGIGSYKEIDPALVIPNKKLSINQGAIKASGWNVADGGSIARMYFEAIAQAYKFSLDIPVEMIPKKAGRHLIWHRHQKAENAAEHLLRLFQLQRHF